MINPTILSATFNFCLATLPRASQYGNLQRATLQSARVASLPILSTWTGLRPSASTAYAQVTTLDSPTWSLMQSGTAIFRKPADGRLNQDKSTDSLAFGFGRRVCPGRYNADGSVWVAMVFILYTFKITKALDEQGKEVDFQPSFSTGITAYPNPFPCSITPRSLNIDIDKLCAEDF